MPTRPCFVAVLLAAALAACSTTNSRTEFAAADPRAAGFDPERFERVDALVRSAVDEGRVAGASYLVLRDGRVAGQAAHGWADLEERVPLRTDTIVRIYSMTKMVTAVAALQLVEDGRLRLDDPITLQLPELAELRVQTGGTLEAPELAPLERPITVRHLLNHTAGFTYDIFGDTPVNEAYRRADLWSADTPEQFLAKVARLPLLRQPGLAFDYSIADDVLGILVGRASGTSLEEHVAARITGPLGLYDTAFDVPQVQRARIAVLHERQEGRLARAATLLNVQPEPGRGFASGGAGLFSTIGDYARFLQCLLQGGTLDGARILSRKMVELALQDSLAPGLPGGPPTMGWGLIAALRRPEPAASELGSPGMFWWGGAASTHFFVDPSERLVALVFMQHFPYDSARIQGAFQNAVYQALE
ncbi:MAG: beta-lactamase family protein [Planctomycetes bacterium]|nr:beta-lactamase family protein [Planctomycetota bacterium]